MKTQVEITYTIYEVNHYILSKSYIDLHRYPKCLYTVAIKGQEQGFTQACQWAMAALQAMVQPMAIKSQNQNITDLHNQNGIT